LHSCNCLEGRGIGITRLVGVHQSSGSINRIVPRRILCTTTGNNQAIIGAFTTQPLNAPHCTSPDVSGHHSITVSTQHPAFHSATPGFKNIALPTTSDPAG